MALTPLDKLLGERENRSLAQWARGYQGPTPSANSHVGISGGRDVSRHGAVGSAIHFLLVPALEILDYLLAAELTTEQPGIAEAIAAWRTNTAKDSLIDCWMGMRGADRSEWQAAMDATRRQPELQDLFTLRNREIISDQVLDKQLRSLGFTDVGERAGMPQLRYEVPGPADQVRFAVRHVFEPDLINEFGYNDEYRPILDAFHHAMGVDYPIFTGPLKAVVTHVETANGLAPGTFAARYTEQQLPEPTWARAYWWSHWILPSPSQGYEMLFRLDPDRDKTGEPRWMQQQDFDLEHLRLLLRANDYPPYWRDKLAAIAFRPPNLRFLRVQLQTRTITRDQAVSQLRQMGFRQDYAGKQADALLKQIADQEAERLLKLVSRQVNEGWELGLVTDEQLRATYLGAGISQDEADYRIAAANFARNSKIAKGLIAEVHKAYLRGRWSWPQAATFLDQVGVASNRRDEYKRIWDGERQARGKELTQAQMLRAVVTGGMDLATYAQRLRNLDYDDSAIELLIYDARLKVAERETKALQALATEADKSERAKLAAARKADQIARQARADLSRHGTPSQLKTWFCNGDISVADVTNRLVALGWPQADIDRLLGECDAKREKLGLKPYPEEAPGSES